MGLILSKISGAKGYFNMTKSFSYVTNGLILNLDAGNTSSYPGTGTTWTDISGNGKIGTLINGVGYNSTNGGNLVFDGIDDYVSVPNSVRTGLGFTGTIEVITNCSGPLVYNERTSPSGVGDGYFGVSSNKLYVGVDSYSLPPYAYQTLSTISSTVGAMNQYAASFQIPSTSGTMSGVFCINGNFENFSTSILVSPGAIENFTTVDIGRARNFTYGTSYCSAGYISIVRIYNRRLSNSELLQNYYNAKSRFNL